LSSFRASSIPFDETFLGVSRRFLDVILGVLFLFIILMSLESRKMAVLFLWDAFKVRLPSRARSVTS
jgi:hypothetical protein